MKTILHLKRGFTLIEMLVVMAILLTLMSIVVPSMGVLRNQAHNTKCVVNLGQQANAFLLVVSDDDGRLPLHRETPSSPLRIYYDYIDEYVDSQGTLVCPKNDDEPDWNTNFTEGGRTRPWQFTTNGNQLYGSYVFNGWLYSSAMSWLGDTAMWFGDSISAVTNPTQTPIATDGYWPDAWPQVHHSVPSSGDENNIYTGSSPYETRIYTDRHYPAYQNFSFVDGHATKIPHSRIPSLTWNRDYP